jgi:hypothetical protein
MSVSPLPEPGRHAVLIPEGDIVRKIHHVTDGELEGLEVSNIDDPDLASIALVCHVHLLPSLLEFCRIDPLVAPWISNIVEMIVHASSSTAFRLISAWQSTDISKIVIGPKKSDVFRNFHPCINVPLNLLVQAPHLRDDLRIGCGFHTPDISKDLRLSFHNGFQKCDIVGGPNRSIVVACERRYQVSNTFRSSSWSYISLLPRMPIVTTLS